MTELAEKADSAVLAFLPGNQGAQAIADVLFGRYNPSARLPITYPKYPNGYTTYDHPALNILQDNKVEYLFPFGHGLSYTKFNYSNLRLGVKELEAPGTITIRVDLENVGDRAGSEVVLLYVSDVYGSVPRPVKQLKKFFKIELARDELETIYFELNTDDDLSFINDKSQRVYEPGQFNVYVGD